MSTLVYSTITSLDGYVCDAAGNFDWAEPDEEVHRFVNDLERGIGTYLYGRGMYETMVFWEDPAAVAGEAEPVQEYSRIWRGADKIVYSTTLAGPSSGRTRVEPRFDPATVQRLKAEAPAPLSVGGPGLAGQALAAGLVDELQLFVSPVVVGGGTRALPDGVRLDLELTGEHRFRNGTVFLRYRLGAVGSGRV